MKTQCKEVHETFLKVAVKSTLLMWSCCLPWMQPRQAALWHTAGYLCSLQTNSLESKLKGVDLQGTVEGCYRHFSVVVWESIISVGRRSGRIDVSIFCFSLECCCLGFEGQHAPCWKWVLLESGWSGILISILSGNQIKWKENWGHHSATGLFPFFSYIELNSTFFIWHNGYK